jgi:hypothetical protein
VNILLDNPMTQFSFEWILSLNRLCQKWGQVQLDLVIFALLGALCGSLQTGEHIALRNALDVRVFFERLAFESRA